MAKWADYAIHAVRFNAAHTHIDRVKLRPDNGDSLGPEVEHARADIVDAIRRKVTFVTTFQGTNGWRQGQPVYIIPIGGTDFIKTVDNGKKVDNLDNLPEY